MGMLPDFRAEIHILSIEEGGRRKQIHQAYRPVFQYEDDKKDTGWDIWPRFLDENGNELPEFAPVPPETTQANFYILSDDLRITEHRSRIKLGVRFQVREGKKIVLTGTVTKFLFLNSDRV
jgi:translation elongation factor EF-Tu-like GTPase